MSERNESSLPVPQTSLLSLTFHQSQEVTSITADRQTLYEVLRDFGALLSFTISFTTMSISHMQSFSFVNSIIKKLYSVEKDLDSNEPNDRKK